MAGTTKGAKGNKKPGRTRAANHTGALYERKDGRWEAAMMIQGERFRAYGPTSEAAADALQRKLDDRYLAQRLLSATQTVAEYLTGWLEESVAQTRKPHTYIAYRSVVNRLAPIFSHVLIRDLTPLHLRKYYAQLAREGLSATYIRHIHIVLSTALKEAVRAGLIETPATDGVRPPARQETERRVLSLDDLGALWEASYGTKWHALWVLLAMTGMRNGEARALHWADIDWERGAVAIGDTVTSLPGGGLDLGSGPKSQTSRRVILLPAPAIEALKAHRPIQAKMRLETERWNDHDLVFPNQRGRLMAEGTILFALEEDCKRAGIRRYTPHQLRHTYATHMLNAGETMKSVQRTLGHARVQTTLALYAHVTEEMAEQTRERATSVFRNRPKSGGAANHLPSERRAQA